MKKILIISLFFASTASYASPPNNTFMSCDEKKINCLAIEQRGDVEGGIHYFYSNNGGVNWQQSQRSSPPASPGLPWFFNSLTCAKNAMHCVALGWYQMAYHGYGTYFMLVTSDRGMNWSEISIPWAEGCGGSYPNPGEFIQIIACDEQGLNCRAEGYCFDMRKALFQDFYSITKDGGYNWLTTNVDEPHG